MRHPSKHNLQLNGFALVATILLMVLLAIITVGTLSLSVVSLRTGNQDSAQARARANARMALMIAIGELQKEMGADQRISAKSDILDPDASKITHHHWTGSWNAWKAGDSASSQHRTIQGVADEMAPTYLPSRNDHFRRWLVSLTDAEASSISTPRDVSLRASNLPSKEDDGIFLVAEGSLGETSGNTDDFVAARLLDIKDIDSSQITGRYGWWVGDESQKARVMYDSYNKTTTLTAAERIYRSQAPGSTGTKSITGLEALTVAQDLKLEALPSMKTLDLVPEDESKEPAKENFHSITPFSETVLADVREGGLKRDLSVLLERPISRAEIGDEFMLYKFNIKDAWANNPSYNLPDTPQEAVPIQDLAAFYQLYDQSRKGGIEYNSADIKTTSPNYGTAGAPLGVTDDYTGMYRQPVPVKIQFVLSLTAEPITAADRNHQMAIDGSAPALRFVNLSIPATDKHKMRLALIPVVTMWNPYNVPITMQSGATSQTLEVRPPSFTIGCVKTRSTGEQFIARELNLAFARVGGMATGGNAQHRAYLMQLNFGRIGSAITFKPGEVRVFSMPTPSVNLTQYTMWNAVDATPGWNSTGLSTFKHSTPLLGTRNRTVPSTNLTSGECNVVFEGNQGANTARFSISLAAGDSLAFTINAEPPSNLNQLNAITNVAWAVAPVGSAMTHYMRRGITGNAAYYYSHINLCNNSFVTRFGRDVSYPGPFINELMRQGIPGGATSYAVEDIQASQIINASGGSAVPLMQFALMAGCEVSESIGEFGGRKHPMRPFLHSSTLAPTVVDKNDATAPYLHGWNWWLEDISSILGALVNNTQNGQGYFGGGYTPEGGVNRVIQQEIPVTPPISIAALSHARLGGFTLANEAPVGQGGTGIVEMERDHNYKYALYAHLSNPSNTLGFQRVTASGQGGLYPNTLQAIGNSYAHPMLEPNKAFNDDYERIIDADDGPRKVVFADHSYLANKALWDDYFFSSITPRPASTIPIFGSTSRDAKTVASDFFFNSKPLPNRRIAPYTAGMDEAELDTLFAAKDTFSNGLADKIASHLMVEGAFNINSTSVEAWKVFFSSLKGKPVAYLDGGQAPQESSTTGTPVSGLTLPVGTPQTGAILDSKLPAEQWLGLRELTDEEVDQLAEAMVKQVRKRGPFLSLSEFVNRRLDPAASLTDPTDNLAVMGALQAALDDPDVDINRSFREDPVRKLDDETSSLPFAFNAAAKGPAAYGSAAYIDQADILRQLGSQITPRGDTFVIRTYGDALDANGKVVARAWCEAIVQRTPEYLDAVDESHLKFSDLQSQANKRFGREFVLTSFRWLNSNEI